MNCLYIHNRRSAGPKESSWFTFHHISEEMERRGHLLAKYSVDYDMTNDEGGKIKDKDWLKADCLFTVFRQAEGPLKIARVKKIPSFLEINYACSQIVNPFMKKEIRRVGLGDDELRYEQTPVDKSLFDMVTYLIGAGNNYTAETYKQYGIKNIKMFRAGIDYDYFVPDFEKRGRSKIKFTFTAAYPNFRKGFWHLAEAWKNLSRKYQEKIELHIFGSEPYAKGTIDAFNHMKNFSNVFYHGFISNRESEYLKIHAEADCMLCPTFAEGQSATALEGMSFGLYPIISPYTGVDWNNVPKIMLSPEPKKWVNELCDAMKYVVDNYGQINKQMPNIRQCAIDDYRWKDFSHQVVDFIENNIS
ncbi:MAG TPA: glycosyltransferase [bacterium]|nr:glycosyltransferase [bacterium]